MHMDGFSYILVLVEDVSGYVWLMPAQVYKATFTARQLVAWYTALLAWKIWVSDNGTHFRNRTIRKAEVALMMQHQFGVVNST